MKNQNNNRRIAFLLGEAKGRLPLKKQRRLLQDKVFEKAKQGALHEEGDSSPKEERHKSYRLAS